MATRFAAAAVVALWAGIAAAGESRVQARTTYFAEGGDAGALPEGAPAPGSVQVISPQLQAVTDLGAGVGLDLRYDLDLVSGASERIADVVSSATEFSEQRHAVGGGFRFAEGASTYELGYRWAGESDYASHTASAAVRSEVLGRNTTVGASFSKAFDTVTATRGAGATRDFDEALDVDALGAELSQVLTSTTVARLSYTLESWRGYQGNPYRRVILFPDPGLSTRRAEPESVPDRRVRHAAELKAVQYVPLFKGALRAAGRVYRDTWDVNAWNAELAYDQYLGERLLLRGRGRWYDQGAAVFWRDEYVDGPVGRYFTGDRELAGFTSLLYGARLAVLLGGPAGLFWALEEADLELKVERWDRTFRDHTEGGETVTDGAWIAAGGFTLYY